MDLHKFWTPVWNAFDPFEAVQPDQMERWYVPRPHSPLARLKADLSPESTPICALLFGHRSSGKTTELTRLAADLSGANPSYFVVWVDADANLANINRVTAPDVLFLMGTALFKMAGEILPHAPDDELLGALESSLETLVREHKSGRELQIRRKELLDQLVCFAATLAGGAAAGPLGAFIAGQTVRKVGEFVGFDSTLTVEELRRREITEPRLRDLLAALNLLISHISTENGVEVVFLVDNLERISDRDQALYLFAESSEWLKSIACRVVYTMPTYLYFSPAFNQVWASFTCYPFASVRVHAPHVGPDVSGEPDEDGYATMRRVVTQRLAAPPLRLDPEAIITPAALDVLVYGSAGIMRDLVALMRYAAREAELAGQSRIGEDVAWEAVYWRRRDLSAALNAVYRQELQQVLKTHDAPTGTDEGAALLYGNYVVSYRNRELWYDVHTAILPLLKVPLLP